ncbi:MULTISPECIES: hypothetical protein [Nostoc]|uniref:Uncharacterized protein n=1 Tax=Nostoc paludosum FACHB-159 TaxID=2692908 RepID=A0ABR8KFK0_9NOSO|nr:MULTISPECIES: hypothetical protein [Nostoc]MBD2681958.1 hypothetical protein [Nostoc sp. FACHB-857]MBD2738328.1 hypothetical protein [Nostoc paludosum FACHB-159]
MHFIFKTNRQERQERQGKSLREFGAASQRNGIREERQENSNKRDQII